jgi:hypothetical protein
MPGAGVGPPYTQVHNHKAEWLALMTCLGHALEPPCTQSHNYKTVLLTMVALSLSDAQPMQASLISLKLASCTNTHRHSNNNRLALNLETYVHNRQVILHATGQTAIRRPATAKTTP